jgi:hypothetical protein
MNICSRVMSISVSALLAIIASTPLGAQATLPRLGDRDFVRVKTVEHGRQSGYVLFSSADSLIITGATAAFELSAEDIRRIDLSRGLTPWRAAAIGGVIGMAGGLAIGIAQVEPDREPGAFVDFGPLLDGLTALYYMIVGGAVGCAGGLGVGLLSPSHKWMRVHPRPRFQVIGFPGGSTGPGLQLSLRVGG